MYLTPDDPRRILEKADENRAKAKSCDDIIRNFAHTDTVKVDPKKGVFSFFSRWATTTGPYMTFELDTEGRDLLIEWLKIQRKQYDTAADELEAKVGVKE